MELHSEVQKHAKGTRNSFVLALLFFGVLMGALDISIVGPAIPSIEQTIHIDPRHLSWIFNIYILFNLVGIPLVARLSDRFGRRSLYTISVALFAVGSLVVSLAHSFPVLIAGRAIQGFGASGIFPVALAVIGDLFPLEKRGRALGLIGAVFGIAFLVGPFMAGTMLLYFHWNALFLVNVPVAVLIMIFGWLLLPSRPAAPDARPDWAGIFLLGLALALYTIALTNVDTSNFADSLLSPSVLPLFVFATILLAILFFIEKTAPLPVINVNFFRYRQIRLVGVISFGYGLFQSSILFLPSLAVRLFGVTPSEASFMLVPLVVLTAIGSPLNGRMVDKFGSKVIILYGLVISTAALVLFATGVTGKNMFYLGCALLGFGLSMRSALNYVMLNEVGQKERASSQGMLIIFISLGQLTGATLVSILSASFGNLAEGFRFAFLIMSVIAFALVVLSLFLKSRRMELKSPDESNYTQ